MIKPICIISLVLSPLAVSLAWSGVPTRPRRTRSSYATLRRVSAIRSAVSPVDASPLNDSSSGTAYAASLAQSIDTEWIVYVDHSKTSLEKGAAATLDAFLGLAPASKVQVKAGFLPKPSKQIGQPWIRCVSLKDDSAMEVYSVDSVDKVYRVLTKHMDVEVGYRTLSIICSMFLVPSYCCSTDNCSLLLSRPTLFRLEREYPGELAGVCNSSIKPMVSWKQVRYRWPLTRTRKPW
jgi:hypothetical protein